MYRFDRTLVIALQFIHLLQLKAYNLERTIDSLAKNSTASTYRASLGDDQDDKAISLSDHYHESKSKA